MSHVDTLKALANITDTALFERLATAVLREANTLYEAIIHTGINTEGKTIKGPLDGITFICNSEPPHMISVHHTTGDRDNLKKKWLLDPSKIRSQKKNAKKPEPGDILKTAKIYKKERVRTPNLVGTLVLTTTTVPAEDVVRDAESAARIAGITIDIWDASRIADFLDIDPDGQYIRNKYLGIKQERLSKKLLHDLSLKSLEKFSLLDDSNAWIDKQIDDDLTNIKKPGLIIISAESGQGKSVACYKRLAAHITNGNYGLILPHEIIAQSYSLEQAINKTLLELDSSLLDNSGAEALSLSFSGLPIILAIEDVNKSGNASSLLEKIASWHRTDENGFVGGNWQIICPVWPQIISSLDEKIRVKINELSIGCSAYTINEGTNAVIKRHELMSKKVTNLEAEKISSALGNDPLLIALHDINDQPRPSKTIENFINNKLKQLSSDHSEFVATEYFRFILEFIYKILSKHIMQPTWSDIEKFDLSPDQLKILRNIAHQGHIFRLVGDVLNESLVFRHDRVRDWLASKAIAKCLCDGKFDDSFFSEPYYSRMIGLSLNEANITPEIINYIKIINPLALFYSLQDFSDAKTETQKSVISAIDEWLDKEETHHKKNEYLRWECLNILSYTDSSHVNLVLNKFKDKIWSYYRAGFRNGDLEKGIVLCHRTNPGVNDPLHEQLIHNVVSEKRAKIIESINELLKRDDPDIAHRSGILRLCGFIGDVSLYNSLQYAWKKETDGSRMKILDDYLWACAQCCGDSPSTLLDPIFDAWASLSDKSDNEGMPSDRNSFAADEIRWAFIKYVPINAIEYFILQANRSELRWPITIMLHGIDHPSAVFHIAHVLAEIQTELEGTDSFSPFASMAGDDWRRQQEDHGISMSTESKNELFNLWSNQELDKHLRKESFKLWSASHNKNDIAILKSFKKDAVLHDLVLKQRVILGDIKALPQLVKKIKTLMTSDYWWQFTRNIWSKELTTTLDYELNKRSKQVSKNWSQIPFRSDWITSKLIMRLPTVVAESMLVKHWEHAKYSSYFVKTALYIATDKLVDLVSIIISNCPKSKKMFEHLSMHFGVKTRKHPGVTKKRQLEVLIPYLDFMEEHDLYSFWELCNENGWFDFRKKHLDQRLQTSTYIYLEYLSPDRAIQSLNDMIEQKQEIWINHWVDNFLKTGMSVEGIITTIFNWIKSQDKIGFKAIKLSLDVILYIGNRNHYYELLKICSPVKNEYIDYFTNAFFLLRSRQLN